MSERRRAPLWLATATLALVATACGAPEETGPAADREAAPRAQAAPAADAERTAELERELRGILTERDPLLRAERLAARLRSLDPGALPAVRRAYDAVLIDRGELPVLLLAEWWARFAPEDAFAWARSEGIARDPKVLASVVEAWAARDPQAALAAFETLRNPAQRDAALAGLVYGFTDADEEGALAWVRTLSRGFERQAALSYLVRRKLLRDGLEPTLRLAEEVEDDPPRFRLDVFRRVAAGAARVDPRRTAEWTLSHIDEPHAAATLRLASVQWAASDGAAAMAFLANAPEGPQRDDAVQESYRRWLQTDREAARAWLRAQPQAPWLEPALAIFALSLSVESPPEALEWVAKVQDEPRRQEAVIKIARRWRVMDAERAEAWVQSDASITPDMWKRIMAPLRPTRPGKESAPGDAAPSAPHAVDDGGADDESAADASRD